MFDPTIIQNEFLGLVGLRQTNDPDFPQLAPDLLYNGDNELLNHPLLNIENISMNAKNFSDYAYPAWSNVTNYKVGNKVKVDSVIYEAIQDNVGQDPTTIDSTYWIVVDYLSEYLLDIFNSEAKQLVQSLFDLKRDQKNTKSLIQTMRFYDGAGNLNDKILNQGKLVGVSFELVYTQNLVAIIERIGLQLTGSAADVPFYVYHSSQAKPIATFTVNQTGAWGFQWHTPATKIKMHSLNNSYDSGGLFFIMYDQNNIGGRMAINRRMNFHLGPCAGCGPYNFIAYQRISRFLAMKAVQVDAVNRVRFDDEAGEFVADPNGVDMWSIDNTTLALDTNWGLNFDVTVRCDLTEFLVAQKDVFANALSDAITVRLLNDMINSTSKNGINTQTRTLAEKALGSISLGGGGLRDKATYSLKQINFEIAELDQVCMPCDKKGGIRVTSFGLQSHGNNLTGR